MANLSKIEWTDITWNPIRGCSLVSSGCKRCYAMHVAARFSGPGMPYEGLVLKTSQGPKWTGQIRMLPEKLLEPIRKTRPRRIFVNSMSDLFHEDVPDHFIDQVFAVMALSPQHTFQILTKRPERMRDYLRVLSARLDSLDGAAHSLGYRLQIDGKRLFDWPLRNVWLLVSAEDQESANQRIPILLDTPATVRGVSIEPLLGPIDLATIDVDGFHEVLPLGAQWLGRLDPGAREHPRLDWVIVGGESGQKARPMHPNWVRSLRDQCSTAGVAFLFKQWGEWTPGENVPDKKGTVQTARWFIDQWHMGSENLATEDGHIDDQPDLYRVGKKAAGRQLDGVRHDDYPVVTT